MGAPPPAGLIAARRARSIEFWDGVDHGTCDDSARLGEHARPTSTALVTGASSGIGVAIARELARRGYALTLVARRADRLQELASELGGERGVHVECISADLTDASDLERIPAEVAARGHVVDLLVNNAGMGTRGHFHRLLVGPELQMIRLMWRRWSRCAPRSCPRWWSAATARP